MSYDRYSLGCPSEGCYSVGIGSDYDGIEVTPTGLEDVSKYPALVRDIFPSLSDD